jgi:predicted PolB exonuclease-like 3'-5' exonuclease
MTAHDSLFVFDIETVPDTDAVCALSDDASPSDGVASLREKLERYHLEITQGKNPFPRQPFHRVVAISFLEAEMSEEGGTERFDLREIRSGGREDASEKELLEGFFSYLGKARARLVSFNGKGFDLPVLKYRAMKYGVSAEWLFRRGDKWNNYQQRYSQDWHCDLLEALSDYGSSAKIKLNEVAAILGVPGKYGTDGSQVAPLYDAGEIAAIRNYCETDVVNTYLVYLRYRLLSGHLSRPAHNDAVADLCAYLEAHGENRPHLREFYDAWRAACGGEFLA